MYLSDLIPFISFNMPYFDQFFFIISYKRGSDEFSNIRISMLMILFRSSVFMDAQSSASNHHQTTFMHQLHKICMNKPLSLRITATKKRKLYVR